MAERMAEELRQAMEMMEQCQQSHSHSQTTGRMREELRQNMEQWQQNPEDERMEDFRQFKEQWERNPTAIFDSFLRSFGSMLWKNQDPPNRPNPSRDDDDEIVESDIELDDSDVVPPDNDPPQKMGDSSTEVTEEKQEAAQVSKSKAMDAISEGKLEDAIDHFTDAITLNPKSAILYANRASIYIKLKKPNAAIRDADAALQINPDSAKGHKVRGIARAMLGLWKEAASDLHVASTLDFDEEIGVMLKKVEPNAKKIEDHHKKYLRLRKEKELRKAELERKKNQAKQDAKAASLLKEGEVIGINSASELKTKLNAATKTSRLAIIYFTATWCGPCRYVSPVYTSLAGKFPKVVFLKVDIDEAKDAAAEWNISSVPCFFFVKNGKEIDKVVGADKNLLEKKIAQHAAV